MCSDNRRGSYLPRNYGRLDGREIVPPRLDMRKELSYLSNSKNGLGDFKSIQIYIIMNNDFMVPGMITINDRVCISEAELSFTASRSGGPGGQNVNKVSTRVTLWFDVVNSRSLAEEDKEHIVEHLGNRMGKDGVLHIVSQRERSQAENRELAVERFVELLQSALKQAPARRKTRIGKTARLRRMEEKKRHSKLKSERTRRVSIED